MADTILVVAEQREGKLNRVSLETIAGAQAISKETGWPVEVVVAGNALDAVAAGVGREEGRQAFTPLKRPPSAAYTSDAYVFALKSLSLEQAAQAGADAAHLPGARLCPAPRAGARPHPHFRCRRLQDTKNGKLLFTRQMFQGKFAADVSFAGEAPVAGDLPDWSLSRRSRGERDRRPSKK